MTTDNNQQRLQDYGIAVRASPVEESPPRCKWCDGDVVLEELPPEAPALGKVSENE